MSQEPSEINNKIKDLEDQLQLKKAFLDVKISFPKGSRYSEEIKKKVQETVNEACLQAADGKENGAKFSVFTPQEVEVLKKLVQRLMQGSSNPQAQGNQPQNDLSSMVTQGLQKMKDQPAANKATLMTLDNVDLTLRKKIAPQSEVRVMTMDKGQLFVEDTDGNRFWIPEEDVEFTN